MNVLSFVPVLALTIGLQLWTPRCGVAEDHLGKLQECQDDTTGERLMGVDLSGVRSLTFSSNGKLAAGLKSLYGKRGPGSLVKIWTIKDKKLLHEFHVPGKAHAVAFSPDSSTVVTADGVGNLGWVSTIRAWELAEGKGQKIGRCLGEVGQLCFSPDGIRLAGLANLSYFESAGLHKEAGVACVGQIRIWSVDGKGEVLNINIPDPRGNAVELWPPDDDPEATKRIAAAIKGILPIRLRFSSNGKQLIGDTAEGGRKIYDSRTGKSLD